MAPFQDTVQPGATVKQVELTHDQIQIDDKVYSMDMLSSIHPGKMLHIIKNIVKFNPFPV